MATITELVTAVMADLAATRPVFHTEADFQHAFAWTLQTRHPQARIRLERRLAATTNERLDVLAVVDDVTVAVELKYPVAAVDAVVDGGRFILRAQGAEDTSQFGFVSDIIRVERLVTAGVCDVGVTVLLSNNPKLWRTPPVRAKPTIDAMFRLTEGRGLAGRLAWAGGNWWRGTFPEAIELAGRYPLDWAPYATLPDVARGEFRWLAATVTPAT